MIRDASRDGRLVGPKGEQGHIRARLRDLLGAPNLVRGTRQGLVEVKELHVVARVFELR